MKIIKLTEYVYTASFARIHPSYLEGFPQREKYLLAGFASLDVHWYKHPLLNDAAVIAQSRDQLKAYIKQEQIDFILFDNPISALLLDEELMRTAIFDCCDWYLDYFHCEFGADADSSALQQGLQLAIADCPYCIFQSTTIRDWYLNERGGRPVMAELILPNGFDAEFFYPGTSKLKFDRPTVLFAGKLGLWYQGLRTVAAALPEGWQLILVGDGPCREEYASLPAVHCTGRLSLPEVADYIRAATVCVMPVDDCSPIATSEYLACGKPVVHMGPRINWMIQDGVNGYLAGPDVAQWRHQLITAAQASPDLLDKARATAQSWLTLQQQLKQWLEQLQ